MNILLVGTYFEEHPELSQILRATVGDVTLGVDSQDPLESIVRASEETPVDMAFIELDPGGAMLDYKTLFRRLHENRIRFFGRVDEYSRIIPVAVLIGPEHPGIAQESLSRYGAMGYFSRPDDPGQHRQFPTKVLDFLKATRDFEALGQAFSESSIWLRKLIGDDLDIGVSVIDRSFRIRYMNAYQHKISRSGACVFGTCWMEYCGHFGRKEPCPWCPVQKLFDGKQACYGITISEVNGRHHFYQVRALPIVHPKTGELIGAIELVRDCTEQMLEECWAAIPRGREPFREAMQGLLGRICQLGFDRARLYIETWDPRYLEGFAAHGEHAGDVTSITLDYETDAFFRKTRDSDDFRMYTAAGGSPDPAVAGLRHAETSWIEGPLRIQGENGGESVFLGKINVDNEPSGRPLEQNREYWPLLRMYADLLAPIVAEARKHWHEEQRLAHADALRRLDDEILQTDTVEKQMNAIAVCAKDVLKADSCHIRIRKGDSLCLVAAYAAPGRIRDTVSIAGDCDTSVSSQVANSRDPRSSRVFTREELQVLANHLRDIGRSDAAVHFESLACCGVFRLMSGENLIGTLVVGSCVPYFFNPLRESLAKDLVYRAQILVESARRLERSVRAAVQLQNLLDAVPADVALIDREGDITAHNAAWAEHVASRQGRDPGGGPSAEVVLGDNSPAILFDPAVHAAFEEGTPQRLILGVADKNGTERQVETTLAPFASSPDGGVEKVTVVLQDISHHVRIEHLFSGHTATAQIAESLREPMERIREMTRADLAVLAELMSGSDDCEVTHLWVVSDGRPIPRGAKEGLTQLFPGVGQLLKPLVENGSVAVKDVDATTLIDPKLAATFRDRLGVRAFLAVPVFLRGALWGTLIVQSAAPREFSGFEVNLLQAAATQFGLVVGACREMRLRDIDKQLIEGITTGEGLASLLKHILEHAVQLTGCQGGHIRTFDWHEGQAVKKASIGETQLHGGHYWRERVRVSETAVGNMLSSGSPRIVNDVTTDPFTRAVGCDVPKGDQSLQKFLAHEKSYASFFLVADAEVVGSYSLSATQKGHFTESRLQLLEDFARRAASALHAAQYLDRMRRMIDLINDILKVERLEDLWKEIPRVAVEIFLAEDAEVLSYNKFTNVLRREACFRAELREEVDQETSPSDEIGNGLDRYIASKGGTLCLTESGIQRHPHYCAESDLCGARCPPGEWPKSVMICRLEMPDGTPTGVLTVVNRKGRLGGVGFSEFDRMLMTLMATKCAIAIERLQIVKAREKALLAATHDLKSPLQPVRLVLAGLEAGILQLPGDMESVKAASRNATLLEALIVDVLNVARGRSDILDVAPFDPGPLVGEVLDIFGESMKQYDIEAVAEVLTHQIWGMKPMIFRVLLNLCSNVLRHGIAMGGASSGIRQFEISVLAEENDAVIRVSDHGPGIPPEYRRSVFDPATQPGVSSRRWHGIGLAAVRLVAEAHGGVVRLLDRPDGKSGLLVEVRWDQGRLRRASSEGECLRASG